MVRGEPVDVWLEWTETPGYRLSVSNVVLFQGSYAYPDDELMSVFREEDRRNLTANNRQYVYVCSVGHLCDRLDVYWGASVLKGRVAGSQSVAAALKTLCIVRKTPVCRAQGFRPPLCQQSAWKTDTERAGRVIHRHWGNAQRAVDDKQGPDEGRQLSGADARLPFNLPRGPGSPLDPVAVLSWSRCTVVATEHETLLNGFLFELKT